MIAIKSLFREKRRRRGVRSVRKKAKCKEKWKKNIQCRGIPFALLSERGTEGRDWRENLAKFSRI